MLPLDHTFCIPPVDILPVIPCPEAEGVEKTCIMPEIQPKVHQHKQLILLPVTKHNAKNLILQIA